MGDMHVNMEALRLVSNRRSPDLDDRGWSPQKLAGMVGNGVERFSESSLSTSIATRREWSGYEVRLAPESPLGMLVGVNVANEAGTRRATLRPGEVFRVPRGFGELWLFDAGGVAPSVAAPAIFEVARDPLVRLADRLALSNGRAAVETATPLIANATVLANVSVAAGALVSTGWLDLAAYTCGAVYWDNTAGGVSRQLQLSVSPDNGVTTYVTFVGTALTTSLGTTNLSTTATACRYIKAELLAAGAGTGRIMVWAR